MRRLRRPSHPAWVLRTTGHATFGVGPHGTTCDSPRLSPRLPRWSSLSECPTPDPWPLRKESYYVTDTDRNREPQGFPAENGRPHPHAGSGHPGHPGHRPRGRRLLRLRGLGEPRPGGAAGRLLRRHDAGHKREDTEPLVLRQLLRRRTVPARDTRRPYPAAQVGPLPARCAGLRALHRGRLLTHGLRERTHERRTGPRRRQRIARRAGRREGCLRGAVGLLERRADGILVDGVPGPHRRLPLARGPQRAVRGRKPEVSHACLVVASPLAKEQVETGGDAEGS